MSHLVIGTAGHIDHGKSTLVHALTGIDPDRLKEEKARGITIELGFAHTEIDGIRVAFVDVPGHEKFVKTMLAGVGGIDCVMLVVAADESVMPQTREHFDICRLLEIPRGIVVLTKSDLADIDMRALVRQDVAALVEGSFLEGADVIDVSATTGEGLDGLRAAIAAQTAYVGRRPLESAARLPIDRSFSMKGFGAVVTGTLVSGTMKLDDELVLLPGDRRVKIRGIQVHGKAAPKAVAGQRTAINLGGVASEEIARGQTLASPGTLSVTRRVDASIDLLPETRPLRHGARIRLHNGTAEVLGRVSIAGNDTEIAPGASALARLRLEHPAVLTRGDRFILRAYSPPITIGGGTVLDPAPTRPGIRTAEGVAFLQTLAPSGDDDTPAIASMVIASGRKGMPRIALPSRGGIPPGRVEATVAALQRTGVIAAGDRLIGSDEAVAAGKAVVNLITQFHKANPLSEGMPREEVREKVFGRAATSVFERVIEELKATRAIWRRRSPGACHARVAVAGDDARVKSAIERAVSRCGIETAGCRGGRGRRQAPRRRPSTR